MESEQPEGATPLDDYSELKVTWIQTRKELDAVEAQSIADALDRYLGEKLFTFPDWYTIRNINSVHKVMFGKIWSWAGKYRTTQKSIGLLPYQIHLEMKKLEEELLYWAKDRLFSPIEISARTHHRLVWIHPYENGNGRHGRLIGDMILNSLNHSYPSWPSLNHSGQARDAYLEALREADRNHFHPLEELLRSLVAKH